MGAEVSAVVSGFRDGARSHWPGGGSASSMVMVVSRTGASGSGGSGSVGDSGQGVMSSRGDGGGDACAGSGALLARVS